MHTAAAEAAAAATAAAAVAAATKHQLYIHIDHSSTAISHPRQPYSIGTHFPDSPHRRGYTKKTCLEIQMMRNSPTEISPGPKLRKKVSLVPWLRPLRVFGVQRHPNPSIPRYFSNIARQSRTAHILPPSSCSLLQG